jgi:hypothetical protein
VKRIVRSKNPLTQCTWSLAALTSENWIAQWFLYHKFRYRDGRNRNHTKSSGTRKHHHHQSVGPLLEVQPAPSPLAGADPSISSLRGCEINQEHSQHWKPDERVAATHDRHPPRSEIHWQRGLTMQTNRNHLQAFGLEVNPIKVGDTNAREAPPRDSQRPKRKREESKPDSEQNSGKANSWFSKSSTIEVQNNDYATKEATQKRARSAPRSPPPVRDKGVQFGVESSSSSSLLTLAKLALDITDAQQTAPQEFRASSIPCGLSIPTSSDNIYHDQGDQGPTIERDSNHTKNPSPSIALHGSGGQKRSDIRNLLNPEVHQAPLEGTPSCIDTNTQRVKFAELSESQYSMTVSQVSTPPFTSNPSLAHVKECRYLKTAPILQGSSTVRIKSFEKINQDPVQHETLPQPTQTLDSEENPARLLATPKPSPQKNVAVEIGGKNTGEYCVKDPFRTHLDSVFPSTYELLDAIDWTDISVNQDLTKTVPKQPRKHPDAIACTTQNVFDRPGILEPERLTPTTSISSPKHFFASRKGSSSEVGSQEDDSRTTQRNSNQSRPECLHLTDLTILLSEGSIAMPFQGNFPKSLDEYPIYPATPAHTPRTLEDLPSLVHRPKIMPQSTSNNEIKKRFPCSTCGKRFAQQNYLTRHSEKQRDSPTSGRILT